MINISFAPLLSSSGLIFDIFGFILISYTIIKPKKPNDSDVVSLEGAFGEPLIDDIVTLDYLKNDIKAKWGFWLIILGFVLQLLGNIYPLISLYK
jgi:hypothetical protein